MIQKFLFVLLVGLSLYLVSSVALQPKLRQVLRLPEISQKKINYACEPGKTALDLLLVKAPRVSVRDFAFGKLVEAIGDLKGGFEGKYWLYFVEGKSATVGADVYRCQNKEAIEWRFESQ